MVFGLIRNIYCVRLVFCFGFNCSICCLYMCCWSGFVSPWRDPMCSLYAKLCSVVSAKHKMVSVFRLYLLFRPVCLCGLSLYSKTNYTPMFFVFILFSLFVSGELALCYGPWDLFCLFLCLCHIRNSQYWWVSFSTLSIKTNITIVT